MKGRKMTAYFKDKQLHRVVIDGNGESIFFALEDRTNVFMGMNRIICSNITIRFREGFVNSISFYIKPEAEFIPPHELVEEKTRLKGFSWKEESRPAKFDVVKRPLR
jgi:hypothetical protein